MEFHEENEKSRTLLYTVHCTMYNVHVQCTYTMYMYNVHAMTIIKQKPHICEIRNKLHA